MAPDIQLVFWNNFMYIFRNSDHVLIVMIYTDCKFRSIAQYYLSGTPQCLYLGSFYVHLDPCGVLTFRHRVYIDNWYAYHITFIYAIVTMGAEERSLAGKRDDFLLIR